MPVEVHLGSEDGPLRMPVKEVVEDPRSTH
jgi:hypothetical protein